MPELPAPACPGKETEIQEILSLLLGVREFVRRAARSLAVDKLWITIYLSWSLGV